MTTPIDNHEAELLTLIAAAFDDETIGEVPAELDQVARSAFGWRRADAALAEIVFDSHRDELVGVRGAGVDRHSFHYRTLGVDVYVSLTNASITIMVDLDEEISIRVISNAGMEHIVTELTTDELGEVTAPSLALPARIELDLPAGTATTPWIIG